jgi:DNA polymerase III delta prime subunit
MQNAETPTPSPFFILHSAFYLPHPMFPQSPSDFIGSTHVAARLRCAQAAKLAGTRDGNFRVLFTGPPGNGKSSLSRLLARMLTGCPDDGTPTLDCAQILGLLHFSNGQNLTIDKVREWSTHCRYLPGALDGRIGRRIFWVEECNAASDAALSAWRTFSDALPPGNDLLLTTNQPLDKLQQQFSSRCQVSQIEAVPDDVLTDWLVTRHQVERAAALAIATTVRGDVRAALNEANEWHALQELAIEDAPRVLVGA